MASDKMRLSSGRDPGKRMSAYDVVRDTLRHSILSGALPTGSRLKQADIAARLNVSTTPVREALRDLASEQLVQLHPYRGAVVCGLDPAELTEIYDIRKALEPMAIRLAAHRITQEALSVAARLQDKMDNEADPATWAELDRKFHTFLGNAADSPRLTSFLKVVQDSSALYVARSVRMSPSRVGQANTDHRALLAALGEGAGDLAVVVLQRHLSTAMEALPRRMVCTESATGEMLQQP